ncbi:hypothetical protein P3T36_003888 [Kitasatospora sp. MAP12-15]|uniref:hypothetical protein n=1 Tax=unclassified Kitasatospora TaxID=2633591 RepID=UPI0024738D63|nr:hypothetical protein [Kitasatospora sp. MAP12-44]MDH6108468.1 hypothetical protein [Kitasatospora sp. MAP12-44]
MSILSRQIAKQRHQAAVAARKLVDTLGRAGITLPSVCIDPASEVTGLVLVDLGRVRPDVVLMLAELIAEGLNACDKQQS